MAPTPSSIEDYSIGIISKFLQTVVVVDDQAFLRDPEETQTTLLVPPEIGSAINESALEGDPIQPSDKMHNLNAKILIDAFADRGLVCSIIVPENETEPFSERTLKVARRSDLVVLDWQINKDDGEHTKSIIKGIIQQDKEQIDKGRIRLIAVYTGEPKIEEIADSIADMLSTNGIDTIKGDDPTVLLSGPVLIEVLAKDHVYVLPEHKDRVISVADLPNRLIADFTGITIGFISNVVIEALSILRSNTYTLSTTFE